MAYGDTTDPKSTIFSIVLVGVFTSLMGYGLLNGLNISIVKKLVEKLDVIEIEEPPPPEEEEPPPPPEEILPPPEPPPVLMPPPVFVAPPTAPTITVPKPKPPPAVVVPPPPPPPPDLSTPGKPKGNPARWVGPRDYPSRALRQDREGTTRIRVTYGVDGRATSCDVVSSSGHGDLDDKTCKLIMRRGRFLPGTDRNGNPSGGTWSAPVRWEIPK